MSLTAVRDAKGPRQWTTIGAPGRAPATGRILTYAVLIGASVVVLAPVVWAVLGSFKSQAALAQVPPSPLPDGLHTENYSRALGSFDFVTYFRNSVLVTVGATVLTLAVNTMCAYGLAKYNFRGRNVLFLVVLGTIMIPLQLIFIPVYQMAAQLGLVNSLWGLIIPPAATPTGVFLLRQYMLTIPDDLIHAARIDGAGEFRIFTRIVVPLCGAAIAVVTIFSVMWRWNDFLWPLIISQDPSTYTLPVAIAQFNSQLVVPFNYILAMSVVSMAPVVVIFLVLQRHIVRGIANTGLR